MKNNTGADILKFLIKWIDLISEVAGSIFIFVVIVQCFIRIYKLLLIVWHAFL